MKIAIKFLSLPIMTIITVMTVMPVWVMAADGAGGDHGHIPWNLILSQTFNVVAVLIILYFVARKAISSHFQSRRAEFNSQVTAAEAQKDHAEQRKKAVSERLAKLKATEHESLGQAEQEAQALKDKILKEANTLSMRLLKDAERTALFELERAKQTLRQELLDLSVHSARTALTTEMDNGAQKKLQHEFVEKIQVVH